MTTTHRKARIATIATLVCVFCISANSQKSASAQKGQDCQDTPDSLCITKLQVDSLEPSWGGRFWRAWQYQYQFSEQPAFTAVVVNGSTKIIANPEQYLNQHTFSFQFSELFPSTSNLASIVGAIYAGNSDPGKANKTVRLDPKLCRSQNTIECIASGGNFWQRLISAVSVNASLSERNEVQQGILVTNFPTSQHYGPAGQLDFDPASLFVTGTNWQTAVASLKGINPGKGQLFGDDEAHCFVTDPSVKLSLEQTKKDQLECINKFARPRLAASMKQGPRTRIGATLIPKFQFKAVSQFDFIKNGGVLISEPGLQRSLKNYTFTWDLRRAIPSTTDRVAALKSYGSYSLRQSEAVKQPKVCITISGTSRGYVPVGDDFTADRCRALAADAGAEKFALACATASSVVIGDTISRQEDVKLPEANTCKWH